MERIYLDYAATTPTDPEVIKAMEPYFYQEFGNASSPHSFGQRAKKAMEDARTILANYIGADPAEIVFTSGATEANNQAIFGSYLKHYKEGNHVIVSKIEHHSVLEPIEQLAKHGVEVTYIDVGDNGIVDPEVIRHAIRDDTFLIAVMHASNEIGTIQPIEEIGKIAREKEITFLVDACQTVGHILVDVNLLKCDLLSLSAHKFYGPKGVGALYIKRGTKVGKYIWGGDQERERRASTQNVSAIVGLGKAIDLCESKMMEEINLQSDLRDHIIKEVLGSIGGVRLNGDQVQRLPNNANFAFEKLEGESLLMSLDMDDIAVSMGSACTSGALEASHVLRAIGLSEDLAYGALRVTLGRWTTREEVDFFLEKLKAKVKQLRI